MDSYDQVSLSSLIRPDRVHKDYYIDPEIFKLEIDRIFSKSWLLVGHESQVPNPGDYVTLTLLDQPMLMSRHRDGSIHVMFNRCSHRGARVCTKPSGKALSFTHADTVKC